MLFRSHTLSEEDVLGVLLREIVADEFLVPPETSFMLLWWGTQALKLKRGVQHCHIGHHTRRLRVGWAGQAC